MNRRFILTIAGLIGASLIVFLIYRNQLAKRKGFGEINSSAITVRDRVEEKEFPAADTIIKTPCAVIINPSSHTIDSLKKVNEEDFYIAADDNMFYMAQAMNFLDSMQVKMVYKDSEGTLAFQWAGGQSTGMNLSKLYWRVLLFNGKTKPIEADITSLHSEFENYMSVK